jgi:hypothetical protein
VENAIEEAIVYYGEIERKECEEDPIGEEGFIGDI